MTKPALRNAWPYQKDKMNLPVTDVNSAIAFYHLMNFQIVAKFSRPVKSIILSRDSVQIGLAENGGDSTQDGCFFEVENLDGLYEEFKGKGVKPSPEITNEKHGDKDWRVFYVVAPDGLCYCFGQKA